MSTRQLVHVDDNSDDAFLFKRALIKSGIPGWEYRHLTGAREATEYLSRAKELGTLPNLLVLDVKMPGMCDLALLEWVVEHCPEVPAVMLSSSDLLADRLRARDLGSIGYFVKSPQQEELMALIRNWQGVALAPAAR
jgi:two-component system nitrogen regulation response regulator GlnG